MKGYTKVYVIRMDAQWDADYVEVRRTLKEVADVIEEYVTEWHGYYFDKDALINHMKEREEIGYGYLINTEELIEQDIFPKNAENWEYWINVAYLPN
jgi:hypothetical protein